MQIPTPPSSHEKYLYVDQNKWPLYLTGLASFSLLSLGMYLFMTLHPFLWVYSIFAILLFFYLNLSYFIGIFGGSFDLIGHLRNIENGKNYYPTVDIYMPSCGEDIEIIRNTLTHASLLDWPRDKIKFYVLDDSKDPSHNATVQEIARDLGFSYISRPNRGELKKAGNIRHAFSQTKGEFFVILDADFAPRQDFLKETVPYMMDDKVAIVQTPQYFSIENDPWIQKGAAYIQELFYRLVQVNRQKWNSAICVGTCALYRRSALEPHGGTAAIGFSEDVHTGFQAICDGYKIQYIPINLSKGVCPDTIQAFLVQQYRWATGSVTLFLNPKFWMSSTPLMVKLNYLSGMLFYIATSLGLLLVPLPGLLMLIFLPERILYYNIVFSFPSFIYGTFAIALWSRAKWGIYAMQARHLSYWAYFLAIVDLLKGTTIAWVATGDKNLAGSTKNVYSRFHSWFTNWNVTILTTSLVLIIYRMTTMGNPEDFAPALVMAIINLMIFAVTLGSLESKK